MIRATIVIDVTFDECFTPARRDEILCELNENVNTVVSRGQLFGTQHAVEKWSWTIDVPRVDLRRNR